MPNFNIIKKSGYSPTFRNESIKSQFDLNVDEIKESFKGSINIENEKWNIGVIYGASGTGKTTIAGEVFGDNFIQKFDYGKSSVLDEMPDKKTTAQITSVFNAVGFSTVWSWLKPYYILSEGEKMRVDLSNSLLSDNEFIIFDEFTSVVNREVAKTASFAIQKYIRKFDKKFIAVSCHSDIIDWIEPDWTFCADNMSFRFGRRHRRPEIKLEIRKAEKAEWEVFKKYHYLNNSLSPSSRCYVGEINNISVCFAAVIHFPHPKVKNYKKVHRLVVLPDYQGIGLGIKFISEIAEIYKEKRFNFGITSSNPVLFSGLCKNKKWRLIRRGRTPKQAKSTSVDMRKTVSHNRLTFSFKYI